MDNKKYKEDSDDSSIPQVDDFLDSEDERTNNLDEIYCINRSE